MRPPAWSLVQQCSHSHLTEKKQNNEKLLHLWIFWKNLFPFIQHEHLHNNLKILLALIIQLYTYGITSLILIDHYNTTAYLCINDFLKMDGHCAVINVLVIFTVMNQETDFLWAYLVCPVTKDKEHGVNNIGFSTSIRTNNGSKALQTKAEKLF